MAEARGWRPRNETPENLAFEINAHAAVEAAWGVTVVKLSETLYGIDWALFKNDRLVAWAEYKYRSQRYDTVLLSAAKWEHGVRLAERYNVPFLFIVGYPDSMVYFSSQKVGVPAVRLGGNARGQNGDKEPCVFLPISAATEIKERK